jgi:hypothetical protein
MATKRPNPKGVIAKELYDLADEVGAERVTKTRRMEIKAELVALGNRVKRIRKAA